MDFELFKSAFESECIRMGAKGVSISDDDFEEIYEDYIKDLTAGVPWGHAMYAAIYYNTEGWPDGCPEEGEE